MEQNNKGFQLIDIKEACKILNIKESHIRKLIAKNEIPIIRIGKLIRFNIEDLMIWIDQQKYYQL